MNDATSDAPESGPESEERGGESRRARSIRFSDSEWEAVEKAANDRGMNAAEYTRHTALGVANGRYSDNGSALPPQYVNLVERIFRSTHILVTLKRDELVREGRAEELAELVRSTRELQNSILENHPMKSLAVGNRDEQ